MDENNNNENSTFFLMKKISRNRLDKITNLNLLISTLQDEVDSLNEKISQIIHLETNSATRLVKDSNYYENIIYNKDATIEELKKEIGELKCKIITLESRETANSHHVSCILCHDQERNVLFRPCNHLVICDTCSGQTSFEECIVCKQTIDSYEYAYL